MAVLPPACVAKFPGMLCEAGNAHAGEATSRQVLELTAIVVAVMGGPLSHIASTAPAAALDHLSRLRAVKLSSALLMYSEDGPDDDSGGNTMLSKHNRSRAALST